MTSSSVADQIDDRREDLALLVRQLIEAPSPNPPGDVTAVAEVARRYLIRAGVDCRTYTPATGRQNIVASVVGAKPGLHIVLNAHMDVFPTEPGAHRSAGVGTGTVSRGTGRVYGRGACDMKGGAAAFLVVIGVLSGLRSELAGEVTLCLVCDEESGGPFGSRFLLEHLPRLKGSVMLSSEPSSTGLVRYGEKGLIHGQAVFEGKAGHAAYPQPVRNPISRAAEFISGLETALAEYQASHPGPEAVNSDDALINAALGDGASGHLRTSVLNFGKIAGGARVNMVPRACAVDVDVRVPVGVTAADVANLVKSVADRSGGRYTLWDLWDASVSDPSGPLVTALCESVRSVTGRPAIKMIGLGATDARFWRAHGVPAGVYGPSPGPMGADDEYVEIDELVDVAKVHALTCVTLLRAKSAAPARN